jgi:hypothetical protein
VFSGYGVGITVVDRAELRGAWPPPPPGVTRRRSRLSELLAPESFCESELVREMGAVADGRGQLAAYDAFLIAQMAARRPAQTDLTEDQPGHGVEGWSPARVPVGVSEFLVDELALMRGISLAAATGLAERSLALVHELPATWEALADGLVDEPRANAIVRALAGQSQSAGGPVEPAVVAEVEAQALEWAHAGETPARLRERTAAALIAVDAAAADRRRKKAERAADVRVRSVGDGMSELIADLPTPVAAACRETVDSYARMAKDDGDERPIGQLRALVHADLILRPWDTSREPVTAHLQLVAPLPAMGEGAGGRTITQRSSAWSPTAPHAGRAPTEPRSTDPAGAAAEPPTRDLAGAPTEPLTRDPAGAPTALSTRDPAGASTDEDAASVDGAPITHQQLRELLEQLDSLCPGGLQAPTGGTLDISLVDPATGELRATVTRPELQRLVRRGCSHHPQDRRDKTRAARPEPDGPAQAACGCPALDRPPLVERYTPSPAQRRFLRARDRTCRHPGCRRPAVRTDLDHVEAHAAGGATDCANLCCLCRRHHRLKTHAPGWRFVMSTDGVLSVTTPSGMTRTTRPPGLRLLTGRQPLTPLQLATTGSPPDADDPPPF